jgi:hypothetical protein
MHRTHFRRRSASRIWSIAAGLLSLFATPGKAQVSAHSTHHPPARSTTMISTPQTIAAEHRELHEVLGRASRETGALGRAARELEEALAPHFRREEEIATPPLGLLPALANGNATTEMRAVLPMTTALEKELPQMLREHGVIRAALQRFRAAAIAAKRPEYIRFSDHLAAHAKQEEDILYPAAVLVGRYVARTAPAN